ncbi:MULTISPECIES: class I SAM-dependent methyltransferase [unclassified Methanoculleus]|jgi:ubiquinone/menaquinone biosynthesis C-methylase UbiE|uniref:class I SAM-dependent methyltransferase n=1 Tax=unclassified Methanoculleus TaxID=2619537 RepID=UPI0025EEAACB|nr:class I SAM-dependent methyltransferase [Methanoculleus sp. UBA377]MDD2473292.1 methyltransferase domain-containing protein [Methanoculleus sp.]
MNETYQVHGVMEAEDYDRIIRAIVPGQPLLLATIVDYLPPHPRRVLELGCGTGILTAMIREECPGAEITGIDLSPEMLKKAAAKPELAEVRFLAQDLRDAWPEGRYDAIVTSLCLHHVSKEERVLVARRALRALSPGGRFICGDIFRARHDWEEEIQREIWCRNMKRGRAPDDVVRGMIAQREANMPGFTTVSEFQDMLTESGFDRATVPFTSGFVGLAVGFAGNPVKS